MRIGIDARLYRSSVAGIGRYSQNLIKNLLKIDSENQYVFLMTPEDVQEFKIQNSEFRISNQKVKVVETDIKHYSLAEQTKLSKIIEKENLDLMHFLNFNYPVNYKGKFVVTIHDLTLLFYPGRSKQNFLYKLAYKYVMGKACHNSMVITAVSESTKKDIEKIFHTAPEKIKVIYEAADDKFFAQVPTADLEDLENRYHLDKNPVILYVGQWRPHKNLVRLVHAFEKVRKDMPCKLVLCGKEDSAFPEAIETIDKSPNLSDIIKPGFVKESELAAWYKRASVFVFPSLYEGFGIPGLEAMLAGTPVASSNRTSLPEIYKDASIYFNPENIEDMAEKIKLVLQDKALREELITKGQKVAHEYSWAKTAQETLKVYREILNLKS